MEHNSGRRGGFSMAMDPETNSFCISRVTRISGKVEFQGLARIEGEAEGDIVGDNIEIAASAVVTARITANSLRVGGQVEGEIVARERIELLPTARLRCTITTPTLVVAEGAQFEGDCKMLHRSTAALQLETHEARKTDVSLLLARQQTAVRRRDSTGNDLLSD
jgi:cytoskeletal protein CcmA (bactofilin family)